MVTHTRASGPSRPLALCTALALATTLVLAASCDKVPLTAPTGSVISLFASANTVPVNGQVEIVATVIENGVASSSSSGTPTGGTTPGSGTTTPGTTTTTRAAAGTPVQNGTVVSFTTTLGRIEPREAKTNNGEVRVTFIPGGQSGLATITAYSGGASGRIENLKVGTAAVERVIVSASPQTLAAGGGTAQITARAEDASGLGLAGVPVTFITDNGTLTPASALTDPDGVATTALTTTVKAKVTATVAGKTADVTVGLNARTGIAIVAPTTPISAGVPAVFTVKVAATANIRNVTVDWGDGRQQSLGAISGDTGVQHTYIAQGNYVVSAVATDTSGFSEPVSTTVTVLPGQPPGVTCTPSNSKPPVGGEVTVTATVTGATSTITGYTWTFGDNSNYTNNTVTLTGNRVPVKWSTAGSRTIFVTVNQASGPEGQGACTVDVGGIGGD